MSFPLLSGEIDDGVKLIQWCGDYRPMGGQIVTSGQTMMVHFHTDSTGRASGFKATVSPVLAMQGKNFIFTAGSSNLN